MRKFSTKIFGLLFFLIPIIGYAQAPVSGKVFSATDGAPIADASVIVKGKSTGTKTNSQGSFTINASKGDVLVISSVNFSAHQVTIKDATFISVKLKAFDQTMDEVVVVAMDAKRAPRELGFSTQGVSGKDIADTKRDNFINGLQGRVAGLSVTPTTGAAGASSGIVLRGYNTISGTNQPLFVIDGIIIDNQTLNSNSQSGTGIGFASDGNNRNNDNTNRIADLNPNDIESVTVLKGPEATALYGSQASGGAIVISTRKAKGTNKKILVGYDNNFKFQKITRFAQVNNDYSIGGSNNVPSVLPLTSAGFNNWGPKWAPGTVFYDNLHNFFRTGFAQLHNISADYGTQNVSFRLTGQYSDNTGVIPNNTYTKYNFKLSNTTKINKYITITPSITYTSADNLKPVKSSAGTAGVGGYMLELLEWPSVNDITNYYDPASNKYTYLNKSLNQAFDNPLWSAYNNTAGDKLNRIVSTLGIDITPYKWLTINGRFGYDTYKDVGYQFVHPESYQLTAATGGSLDNYWRTYYGYNHTISATAKKNIGKFTGRLMVGTQWQDLETKMFAIYGTNIVDSVSVVSPVMYKGGSVVSSLTPNLYDSSITTLNTRKKLLRNYNGLPNESIFRELAYFAEASVGFNNYAFLTYTQRFESSSPIPAAARNYHYPGVSLSLILSDMIPGLKNNFLSFAKLRASQANTARLIDPYLNQALFVNNFSSSTLPVTYTYGFTNNNPNLVPERQKTYEVGTELRFFNDAISIDAAYYNTLCTNQIAQGYRASYGTGYVLNTQNAASLRNQGIEIAMIVKPIVRKNFDWTINFNFNHMWSEVLTLPSSLSPITDYYNSDTYLATYRAGLLRGHSTGTLTGTYYVRNNAGQILITASGLNAGIPLTSATTTVTLPSGYTSLVNGLIADRTPKFTLGTLNTLHYKNFTLSFLWDLRVGGDIMNGTDELLTYMGKSQRTANRSTPIIVKGVLKDGLENTANPTINTYAVDPQYVSAYYSNLPDEEFVQKNVNWLRLRDLTLNYRLPKSLFKNGKFIKGLSVFLTGNDLILITNYYGADPGVSANNPGSAGVGGYGIDLSSAPTPMGLSFGLRANF